MATRNDILAHILEKKAIAVIRMTDIARLTRVIDAIRAGGVECVEITMSVPGAIDVIKDVSRTIGDKALIGAGTVIDAVTARRAINAGAEFIVGPVLDLGVIGVADEYGKVVIPGAFSPGEIVTAWQAGADIVKVFPATVLGPGYLKDLGGPLPQIRLCPTGGVTVENAGQWIKAGACCVGIGTDLLDKKAIAEDRYEVLTEKARRMVANMKID
ncbi:MAG: bifunctional 4-hydroxy-2-oxoglutarate aldolase/2-dehydro-3-deoxy-phosphogluconate aldolase [Fidelibacterota bacterium]|nr:MAG: bifunctional 4-hydroxy-2-oxoglutarate aldolase/2-dehydro-3-deoxy-phosphogluconate aldolase [Candidatus Neomarinimicrobiota bacterium]